MQEGINFSSNESLSDLCQPSIKDPAEISDLKAIAQDILSKIADVENTVNERMQFEKEKE